VSVSAGLLIEADRVSPKLMVEELVVEAQAAIDTASPALPLE
jgi:hypothetical protein